MKGRRRSSLLGIASFTRLRCFPGGGVGSRDVLLRAQDFFITIAGNA